MTELYIFSQDGELLTILSESTGLIEAPFREELNAGSSFSFTAEAEVVYEQAYDDQHNLTQVAGMFIGTTATHEAEQINVSPAQFIVEENQVVFRDHEGDLRLYVVKEVDDIDNIDGAETTATCEPAFMELRENIVVDRRFVDQTADKALDAALENTRWSGKVEVDLFKATTNFYYIDSVEAIEKIVSTWGGEIKDVVTFDLETNKITAREIIIKQRLGADNGLRFEIDHNMEEIQRTVLSYPLTAMYGRGSSLELEDEEGEATGGHSRYIDFADVEWKESNGDPVDKPIGQKWVGDPKALEAYGRLHNGKLLHRYGIFSNQDYEVEGELLQATWEALQEAQQVEVNYQLKVYLMGKSVSLGDTAQAIDRQFARPIEIQTRIIALEYDLLDVDGTMEAEMGQFLSAHTEDPIRDLEGKIDDARDRADQANRPIDKNKYPDIKPDAPTNVTTKGGFQAIQLYWDYTDEIYVRYYEVYGSQQKDFVPDSQHLLWKGDVSAFAHEVETDQTWYYYVRAVNFHDRPSDYSGMVQASTVRVMTDDILFGEIIADHLEDNLDLAKKLSEGTLDWINESPLIEIQETENRILGDVSNRIGDVLDDIDLIDDDLDDLRYQDTEIIDRIDGLSAVVQDTTVKLDDLTGEVEHHSTQMSTFDQRADRIEQSVINVEGDLDDAIVDMSLIEQKADNVSLSISELEGDLENWGVGNRNLFSVDSLEPFIYSFMPGAVSPVEVTTDYLYVKIHGKTSQLSNATEIAITFYSKPEISEDNVIRSFSIENVADGVDFPIGVPLGGAGVYVAFTILGDNTKEEIKEAKIKIEEGDKPTAYSPAPEDAAGMRNVLAYIDLSPEGVTIGGDRIHLSGKSIIDDGVIGTAAIANLAVDAFHLKRGIIDDAHIDELTGRVIKAGTITADHLNVGALSAVTANLGSVVGGKITQESFGYKTVMERGDIDAYTGGNLTSRLNGSGHRFYRSGDLIGIIGTASLHDYPSLRGLNFQLGTDAYYMAWSHLENPGDSYYTIKLAWYKNNQAYDVKGFNFSDNVSIDSRHVLYVPKLSTTNYTSGNRHIVLSNYTWNGYEGVAFIRGSNANGSVLFLGNSRAALTNSGNAYIEVGNDGKNYVKSMDIRNRTYTSTSSMMRVTVNGVLGRSTSSRRYKLLEEKVPDDYAERILELDPKSWFDKRAVEDCAYTLSTGKETEEQRLDRIGGIIAEDVHDAGLSRYVSYDDRNRPDGLHDNLWTLLIPNVRNNRNEIKDLRLENQLLKERVKQLERTG